MHVQVHGKQLWCIKPSECAGDVSLFPPLQEVLKEYIHGQMSFHAKALEIYTAAFQHVQNMNEDEVVDVSWPKMPYPYPNSNPTTNIGPQLPFVLNCIPVSFFPFQICNT